MGTFFIFDVRSVLGIAFYAGQVVCESRGVLRDLNVTSSFLGSYQIHKHNGGTIIKQDFFVQVFDNSCRNLFAKYLFKCVLVRRHLGCRRVWKLMACYHAAAIIFVWGAVQCFNAKWGLLAKTEQCGIIKRREFYTVCIFFLFTDVICRYLLF